jgi:hypothetical protein
MFELKREKVIFFIQIFIILVFILSIIVPVNLTKLFKNTRNLIRIQHLEAISNAVYTYYLIYQKFPDCIPNSGKPIEVRKCKEIETFLTSFPKDPLPDYHYLLEYFGEKKQQIRIFSNAPEAKGIEVIH